jgi:hypothetical protein
MDIMRRKKEFSCECELEVFDECFSPCMIISNRISSDDNEAKCNI